MIPLHLNWAQREYWEHRTSRDLILKARQMGFTTLICALYLADCLLRPNTTSVIVAHDLESAQRIFRIVGLFWERLPAGERRRVGGTRFSNRQELLWPRINSHFYVGTAGNASFGRGMTIANLHCSEYAFWPRPEESLAALLQAVPQAGRVIVESTANGIANHLHTMWQEAAGQRSDFCGHFYVWWENPSYRLAGPELGELSAEEKELKRRWRLDDNQLRWRRAKQRELRELFRQEYPEDDTSCFLASTRACFDLAALQRMAARIAAEPKPESLAALSAKDGRALPIAPARLLAWRRPQEGRQYAIGADVGEGLAVYVVSEVSIFLLLSLVYSATPGAETPVRSTQNCSLASVPLSLTTYSRHTVRARKAGYCWSLRGFRGEGRAGARKGSARV